MFVPNIHKLQAPLNELLKKDKKWIWTQECQEAFQEIKNVLTSDFLTYYDPKKEIVVVSDASAYGIGACILHEMEDGK